MKEIAGAILFMFIGYGLILFAAAWMIASGDCQVRAKLGGYYSQDVVFKCVKNVNYSE